MKSSSMFSGKYQRRWIVFVMGMMCLALVACGVESEYDLLNLSKAETQALMSKHQEMLREASSCWQKRCEGEGELKTRNELKTLKCHTLNLTLTHYEKCKGGTSTHGANGGKIDNKVNCIIEATDVSLLYESLRILRC